MSKEDTVQTLIREAKEILTQQSTDEFVKFIETKTNELEKADKFLESIIVWHFFEETMENMQEEALLAYVYSKLISRYLMIDDVSKAEEMYKKSSEKDLSSFHLNTVRTIFERRTEQKSKKEVIEVAKKDVFGDFTPTVTAPNILFENNTQIRNYILNELPGGTYIIKIFNHKQANTEDLQMTTETLEEFEVISVNEIVRID